MPSPEAAGEYRGHDASGIYYLPLVLVPELKSPWRCPMVDPHRYPVSSIYDTPEAEIPGLGPIPILADRKTRSRQVEKRRATFTGSWFGVLAASVLWAAIWTPSLQAQDIAPPRQSKRTTLTWLALAVYEAKQTNTRLQAECGEPQGTAGRLAKESQSLAPPPPKDANDEEFSALFDKVMKMDKDMLAKAVVITSLEADVGNLKKDVEFERRMLRKMRAERKTLQKPAPEKSGDAKEQRAARYKRAEGAAPEKAKASQEDPKMQELKELIPLAEAYLLRLEGLLREKRNALKQQRAEHATMKRQYEESAQQPINIGKDY
ncbi:MAG: hypothetical protein V2B18_23765, partial [Pseudomonadota bacterium]